MLFAILVPPSSAADGSRGGRLKSANLAECGIREWDVEFVDVEQEILSARGPRGGEIGVEGHGCSGGREVFADPSLSYTRILAPASSSFSKFESGNPGLHAVILRFYSSLIYAFSICRGSRFEIILAANYLDIKALLDLTCAKVRDLPEASCQPPNTIHSASNRREPPQKFCCTSVVSYCCCFVAWQVASMIKGKTPEEIRKQFNIVNDFTPEEEAQVDFGICLGVADVLRVS